MPIPVDPTQRELIFEITRLERLSLVAELRGFTREQWDTQSLCEAWSVREVVAHLDGALAPNLGRFALDVLTSGGSVHRANLKAARRGAERPTEELVDELESGAASRVTPPVTGAFGPLTDILVHAGDIRLPLGMPHEPSLTGVKESLHWVGNGRPVGFVPKGRLDGLEIAATDIDVRWGAGAEVRGRGIDLLMAVCGRRVALEDLRGPGVAELAARL